MTANDGTDFCFPCNQCNSSFDSLRQLRGHQCASQNPLEAIRLNVSNKIAESMTLKISKLETIHADETQSYGEEYKEPRDLKKHERYQCIMCPKSFQRPEKYFKHMVKHERVAHGLYHHKVYDWFCKLEGCERQFKTNKEMKEHKANDHGMSGSYKCYDCDFTSPSVTEMEGHMVRHMEGIKTCQHCDFTCTELAFMKKHMEKHNERNALTCPECGKGYKTEAGLIEHMTIHNDLIQPKYETLECKLCETSVKSQFFSKHMKKHERQDEKLFPCTVPGCKKRFLLKKLLLSHRKAVHDLDAAFKCDHCDFTCSGKKRMDRHVVKHSEARDFICQECGKGYKTEVALKDHILWHTGVFAFQCDICNTKYLTRGRYNLHKKITHETPPNSFSCPHCEFTCNTKHYLGVHMTKHTGEKKYKCRLGCEKTFRRAPARSKHEMIHKGIKNWECSICKKAFYLQCKLQDHVKRHLGQKDYVCTVCKAAFVEPSGLRRHKCSH